MKNLFNNTDADFCSLIDYVKTFLEERNDNYNVFQLPPIQRNPVWNIAQIERLWDSLLRGFPIGSFLVASRKKDEKARDLYTGKQKVSAKEGYFLLDGQQRTRALLLGFKPNEDARLWIDLNPELNFDNVELNDRKFLLRLITTYQPWGMSDRNPIEKLYENQKFQARQELGIDTLRYDYQVEIDNGYRDTLTGKFSWPVKALLPVPLDELIKLCGGTSGKFVDPKWDDVCKLIPDRYHKSGKVLNAPTDNFNILLEGLKPILDETRSIVLLFQKETKTSHVEDVQDDMEVLFRRVNAGGTILQGEEMSYSLLKSSWDGAYDMVSKIVDDTMGYLLSSTGIVMAATRLARFIQNSNDVPNPGIGNFRRWVGEKNKENSFLEIMQGLLQSNNEGKSKLNDILVSFCDIVLYRKQYPGDIGLPRKLLLSIKPAIYHPVFIWIYLKNCNKELIESSRQNVLRYLIYCFLTVDKQDKVSKLVIELFRKEEYDRFPDKIIYDKILENELTVKIPTPNEYAKPFQAPIDGFFRHWNDIFNIPDDPFNAFRNRFWNESKELLLWLQRDCASKWFKGYDPTSNDAYDTPYDWDHIMPKSHLIVSGASPYTYSEDQGLNNKFKWNKHLYVNSIGNLRLWPFWANRSDNNRCHTYKLRMEEPNWENDSVAKELGLISVHDFLAASVINIEDEDLWYNAGGEPRDWPEERRIAWQKAVERRVCYLYEILYHSFGFSVWKNN